MTATVRPPSCFGRPRTRGRGLLQAGPGSGAGRLLPLPRRPGGGTRRRLTRRCRPQRTAGGRLRSAPALPLPGTGTRRRDSLGFHERAAPLRSRCTPGPARIPSVRRGPPRETAPLAASHGRGQGGDRRRHHGGGEHRAALGSGGPCLALPCLTSVVPCRAGRSCECPRR